MLFCCHLFPSIYQENDSRRNKPLIHLYQLPNQIHQRITVERRQGNSSGRLVESLHVLVWSEQADLSIAVLVGFHSFEAGEGIMEDAGCRVEGEVLVRGYAGG